MAEQSASQNTKLLLAAFAAWVITFGLTLWQQWSFIESDFLFLDDAVLLPRILQDGVTGHYETWHVYLVWVLGSFEFYKVVMLAILAGAPAIIAMLLYRLTDAPLLAVAGAVFLVSYPMAVDQSAAYITAAHPTFGAMLALASLGIFWFAWRAPVPKFLFGIVTAGLVAYLSSLVSPTTRLMVVAPVLWVAVMSAYQWLGRKRSALALLALSIPLALRSLQGLADYQYTKLPGRVVISIPTMLASVIEGAESILAPLAGTTPISLWLYLGGLVALAAAVVVGIHAMTRGEDQAQMSPKGSDIAVFLVLCLLTSVLVFGPSSVLTLFRPRYAVPTFLFAAVGFGAAIIWLVKWCQLAVPLALGAFVVVIAANAVRGDEMRAEMFGKALQTHKRVAALVEKEKLRWGDQAQIVIILEAGQRSPTYGWTDFSTWYLRGLADHRSLTGLVGGIELIDQDPFAVKSGGVEKRLRMKGIKEDLPIYLYEASAKGSTFRRKDILFLEENPSRTKIAKFGTAAAPLSRSSLPWRSCHDLNMSVFVWPVAQELIKSQSAGRDFVFNGDQDRQETLEVEPGSLARLRFRLHSEGAYEADTLPQMPMKSDAVIVYRSSLGFVVTSQDARQKWYVKGGSDAFFEIVGIEGCFMYVLANGSVLGRLSTAKLSGKWSLGGGLAKRYWRGEITGWSLSKSPLLVIR